MEEDRYYKTVFNNTGTATIIVDEDTTISLANAGFEKLSGFSREEVEGKLSWVNFVHEDDLGRMKDYHIKRREDPGSAPRNYECRVKNRCGEIKQVIITIDMLPGTMQSIASLVDITETLKMRETLEHRLEFEKILTRISGNFINLPTEKLDSGILEALEAIGTFKGADRSYIFLIEGDGLHLSNTHEWCAPGVRSEKANLQHHRITEVSWTFEQLLNNRNIDIPNIDDMPPHADFERKLYGRQNIKSLAIVPLYYEKSLRGFLGLDSVKEAKRWDEDDFAMLRTLGDTIVNGIERKHFEEELERSEKNFRDFVNLLPQVVFEADLEGKITFANQYAFDLFGYMKEDMERGISLFSLLDPADSDRAKQNIEMISRGETVTENEYTGLTKSGRSFPILVYATPVYKTAGISGIQGIIIDITLRKNLEEQLQQSQKMEAVGRLAGGIAHDFNNMLTSIMGFSSILRLNESLDEESREAVESIMDVARSGANLTRQLLSFSRKDIVRQKSLLINNVVRKVMRMLRRLVQDSIVIEAHLHSALWEIQADPGQIEQIVINLILNSQDALPGGGVISINTYNIMRAEAEALDLQSLLPADYVVLEVVDNGRGMDEEVKQKVFEPFFTTKQNGRGTGLGLSTVYGIASQNGGAVHIESQPNEGTTITVFWPKSGN